MALLVAMALSTTWWPASKPIPGERVKFDAAAWAADHWESTVLPGIQENAVDVSVLLPLIAQDPEAAGKQYGHHDGTSPYTYPVTVTGTAGRAENGLLPIEVPGLPKEPAYRCRSVRRSMAPRCGTPPARSPSMTSSTRWTTPTWLRT